MTKQNNNSLLKIFNIILATLLISHAFYFNEFSYETVFNFFEGHVTLLSMICKDYNPSCFMILFLSVTFLIGSLIMKIDFIKKAWFPTLMYAFFWRIYAYCYPKGKMPDIAKTGSNGKVFLQGFYFSSL